MSLEKGIKSGKEHRKRYYRSKRFDRTCRPGGSCPYCQNNRQHNERVKKFAALEQVKEFKNDV